MRSRQIWAVAIIWGVVGILGGQTARAQAPASARFVKLLLMKEALGIKTDTKALNTRDKDIAKLNIATSQRQIKELEKTLSKLHRTILTMTTRLQVLSGQVYTDSLSVAATNPELKSKAFANLLTVQTLSLRAGLGVSPATPSQ